MIKYVSAWYNRNGWVGVKYQVTYLLTPEDLGVRGNSAADSAAKDALDGNISDELIPFSDIKTRVNKYLLELWPS